MDYDKVNDLEKDDKQEEKEKKDFFPVDLNPSCSSLNVEESPQLIRVLKKIFKP